MHDLLLVLLQLINDVGRLGSFVLELALSWAFVIAWVVWWLRCVNWKTAWPVLKKGGWVPALLLAVMTALAWSAIAPSDWTFARSAVPPNFWSPLGPVSDL